MGDTARVNAKSTPPAASSRVSGVLHEATSLHCTQSDRYISFDLKISARVPLPKRYRLIILGAGFSRPAGLPLASDLWREIRETAAAFSKDLRAHKFNDDLAHYIEFRREAVGEALTPETVDFEDFMRFLDVEHFLGLRGGETWSQDGNEGTVVTKFLIGKVLARHVSALETIPELYVEFARRLQPDDYVLTFNYDTLLERALDVVGKPYRLFDTRLNCDGSVDNRRDEVVVLKMHGSIDWFDRTGFERRIAIHSQMNAPPPSDIIFSDASLELERVVDGYRHDSDPLRNIYRARNLKALYDKRLLFMATPRILPPSAAKLLYATRLNNFWEGMGNGGYYSLGMAIVGFSLPDHDEYARQILYAIIKNYQRHGVDADSLGRRKSQLAIVDYFSTENAENKFRDRYRFVDWSRTNLVGTGFDLASLEMIFA